MEAEGPTRRSRPRWAQPALGPGQARGVDFRGHRNKTRSVVAWHAGHRPTAPMNKTTIERIHARQVLDSRGNPTVEAEVLTAGGGFGRAIVPSGASTGAMEAVELRDGGDRWGGKGVTRAVANIRERPCPGTDRGRCHPSGAHRPGRCSISMPPRTRQTWGPTPSSPSRWRCRGQQPPPSGFPSTATWAARRPGRFPVPCLNVLNGGAHAANSVDIQEFMIVPGGLPSFSEALRAGTEVYQALKKVIGGRGLGTNVGDEGGFAPDLPDQRVGIGAPGRGDRCRRLQTG